MSPSAWMCQHQTPCDPSKLKVNSILLSSCLRSTPPSLSSLHSSSSWFCCDIRSGSHELINFTHHSLLHPSSILEPLLWSRHYLKNTSMNIAIFGSLGIEWGREGIGWKNKSIKVYVIYSLKKGQFHRRRKKDTAFHNLWYLHWLLAIKLTSYRWKG